ncbi:hypothetical protein M2440_004287 [Methylorubrum extorquens]|nr:hypothetical protein [Methylorubrum extorquens]
MPASRTRSSPNRNRRSEVDLHLPVDRRSYRDGARGATRGPSHPLKTLEPTMAAAPSRIRLHHGDLPPDFAPGAAIAIDTETLGLNPHRDRLCVVQVSRGDGSADVVQIRPGDPAPERLKAVLADAGVVKIFHFARFDLAVLFNAFGVMPTPVYCTKIASKLARTYTDRHGLKDVVRELVGVDLSKQQQSSDWGRGDPEPSSDRLRGIGRAPPACRPRASRRHAGPRGPHRDGAGLFRLPSDPIQARSRRLAGDRHLRPRLRLGGLPEGEGLIRQSAGQLSERRPCGAASDASRQRRAGVVPRRGVPCRIRCEDARGCR